MKDNFGVLLEVGQKIAYVTRQSSSMYVKHGVITSLEGDYIHVRKEKRYSWEKDKSRLYSADYVFVDLS